MQTKIAGETVSNILGQVGPALRAQSEKIAQLEGQVTFYQKRERVEKLASDMENKNLDPESTYDQKVEKLMLTHIEAGDEELRQLASQRANAVQAAILRSGKVEAERLFIVEPKTLSPEKRDKVKNSRVEFKIG